MSSMRKTTGYLVVPLILATLYTCLQNLPFYTSSSHVLTFVCGILVSPILKHLFLRVVSTKGVGTQNEGSNSSVYGLDHGRLHIKLPVPMWMNMGFWKSDEDSEEGTVGNKPTTLSVASTRLLQEVLKTAGFSRKGDYSNKHRGTLPSRALLDLGFGCGDQMICLMSPAPIRESDREWWGERTNVPILEQYIGLTLDNKQYQYAQQRVQELRGYKFRNQVYRHRTKLFCTDAANPEEWDTELKENLNAVTSNVDETWVLALDTLYHFSPSRWPLIFFVSQKLKASLMAFDLCLADHVSLPNLLLLRIVTKLMGAPWANFITKDQYQAKLVEAGYQDMTLKDVSEHVFDPLATFLGEQDERLRVIGYGLGPFHAARWMFRWWGKTGIIRGVIVVAKKPKL